MRRALRATRAGKVAIVLAAVGLVVAVPVAPAVATAAPSYAAGRPGSTNDSSSPLAVSLVRMTPWTPPTTNAPHPLTITVKLSNTTDAPVTHVVLRGFRGGTITTQEELTSAKAATTLPSGLYSVPARAAKTTSKTKGKGKTKTTTKTKTKTIDVPVGEPVLATFRTTTAVFGSPGLCLCANGIYPLYVAAYDSRTDALEGFTQTYVSEVDRQSDHGRPYRKVGVAWLWPLIDRPHRLTDGSVFTDNDLAAEIAPDGRLDRALAVVENVGPDVPVTMVIDPELVDELAVMATGHYTYLSANGKPVRGTDGPAASQWLSRLRTVLAVPGVTAQYTPYADPAIESLSDNDLPWRTQLPPVMLARVERALGVQSIPTALSWPPGAVASRHTLNQIAEHGSTSVVLQSSRVTPSTTDGVPSSLVALNTSHGQVAATLLSSATQNLVADVIARPTTDLSALPAVLAQVSVRADANPVRRPVAFLSPPRYVDADPARAEAVIRETSTSAFSTPASVGTILAANATSTLVHGHVRPVPDSTPSLPTLTTADAASMRTDIPALRSLLGDTSSTSTTTLSPAAATLANGLRHGLQRTESAAWLPGSTVGRRGALALAVRLRRQVRGVLGGVRIVRPPTGHYTYTLASRNSPLPITVENTTPYRAYFTIDVHTVVGGLPGVTTTDLVGRNIAPQSKQTFRVQAHVSRSGSIQLFAVLTTANGHVLGPHVRLSVHSTIFGTVGIIITIVAAAILFLALALRYTRRLTRLRRKRRPATAARPVTSAEPVR